MFLQAILLLMKDSNVGNKRLPAIGTDIAVVSGDCARCCGEELDTWLPMDDISLRSLKPKDDAARQTIVIKCKFQRSCKRITFVSSALSFSLLKYKASVLL